MYISAGSVKTIISPELPVEMAGYPGMNRIGEHIRDDLYITVLHLRSGRYGLILLCMDLMCLTEEYIRRIKREVSAATGIEPGNVIVACTNCWTSPVTGVPVAWDFMVDLPRPSVSFMNFIVDRAAETAAIAAATTRRVIPCWFNFDVEGKTNFCCVLMGNKGPEVLIFVTSFCGPFWGPERRIISADMPGILREKLRSVVNDNTEIIFLPQPLAGDLVNRSYGISYMESFSSEFVYKVKDYMMNFKEESADRGDDPLEISYEKVTLKFRQFSNPWEAQMKWTIARENWQKVKRDISGWESEKEIRTVWLDMVNAEAELFFSRGQKGIVYRLCEPLKQFEILRLKIGEKTIVGIPALIPEPLMMEYKSENKNNDIIFAGLINPYNYGVIGAFSAYNRFSMGMPSPFGIDELIPIFKG